MAQPPAYAPAHAFISDSAVLANFPGQALDVEFNNLAAVTGAIETNLGLIQRNDGALANGVVTYDSLSAAIQTNGLAPAAPWASGVAYMVGSAVVSGNNLYTCLVAHTSGAVFSGTASGNWQLISSLLYGAGTNITLVGSTFSLSTSPVLTTPNIGVATATSINGNTFTSGTYTLTGSPGKTFTFSNTLTLAGTDGTTMTFPSTSDTVAGLAATQALTNKTLNGNTFTTGTYTLTGAAGKTLTFNNTLTLAGTDSTTQTFPATSATIARTDAGQTFTGTQTFGALTATTVNGAAITAGTGTLTLGSSTLTINSSTAITPAASGVAGWSGGTLTTQPVGQYSGTATNDNATAGNIGEYVESILLVGSAVSQTTSTPKTVTSISLTAGDWEVSGVVNWNIAASTSITQFVQSLSTTTNALDLTDGRYTGQISGAFVPGAISAGVATSIPPCRFSLSTTTTIYLVSQPAFTAAALSAYGIIRARRMR